MRRNIEAMAREAAHAFNDRNYKKVEAVHEAFDLSGPSEDERLVFAVAYVKARQEG